MASSFTSIDVERIEASRYVSAVGLVILLWDHILTFPDEVRFIWKARLSIPKVLFTFNRYMVPFAMIVQAHEFSGIIPYLSVTVWYTVGIAVGMLSIATSNFLILLRLWVLWDRRPRLMLATFAFYIVTQLVALSLAGYVIYDLLPMLFFDRLLRICIPISKPKLVLLWSPGIAFELMVFLTTVWNALDQPRQRNVWMTKIMYRDGSVYFLALFGLRLVNMVLSIVAPVELIFLGVFLIWSISNITLTRLILNLRRESDLNRIACNNNNNNNNNNNDAESVNEYKIEVVDRTELPVLLRRECNEQCVLESDLPPVADEEKEVF